MEIKERIHQALESENLLPEAAERLLEWLDGPFLQDWARASIASLVQKEAWEELNDRFYQNMAFGTGGMRGRTIGRVPAPEELEDGKDPLKPKHAAVGSNVLNDVNVIRATIGLFHYAEQYLGQEGRGYAIPTVVIAHDVRFFSRHFCELTASTWSALGGNAFIFDGPRSTPQLSFTVRELRATCGVVITASHNPPHDNGYKCYFEDGAQVVAPHAEGIIERVNAVRLDSVSDFYAVDLGRVRVLDASLDQAYQEALMENVLDGDLVRKVSPKIVFSAIHGTGGVASVPALRNLGVEVVEVPEQARHDPRFPTVKSPNPENAEALRMGVETAEAEGASVVLGMDPDADRMGVAVRDGSGQLTLLNGNQIGSALAEYRIRKLVEQGVLPEGGTKRAALIKTFVTTGLQEAIANHYGLKVIETLTGFKYIGDKLLDYEEELKKTLLEKEGWAIDYDATPMPTRRRLLLEHSTYYVFGGEESYGYLASDRVRDKDANAAAILFSELAAWIADRGLTFPEFLDEIYRKYGFYDEALVNVYYEGAAGAAKIRRILETYRSSPPEEMNGSRITRFIDFGREDLKDADGLAIPKQDFYRLELEDGTAYAVRGSGTEPKIKFYTFGREDVGEGADLESVKTSVRERLASLGRAIEEDAALRAEG